METKLLTAAEAATKLRINKRTILKWARDGKIESEKISRKVVLFAEEAIDRFLKSTPTRIQSERTNHQEAGRTMPSPAKRKGGNKRSSGELVSDLRKEVMSWL
ncbi:MAG: helix-turn-helix domain-containing protein [Desulfomonilaceae bacterium]